MQRRLLYGLEVELALFARSWLIDVFELAHRFQCKTAIRRIETQLMSPENDDLKALFKGADRYQLVQLTREILSTLTKEEIKALSLENSFKDPYSPETMAEIIDRFVEL
ncbi:hypothetical protein QR680_012264 [Steinernema hermaphroditum]|uniref:Uncharacterized protein n=1 Tax=Steinernema hermaphroditum TaxID=289476 RepID=A0AA39M0H0_9BILA|nr:hypothetical protein QR680_012264 [Steinernema hermaphroditum]